MGPPAAPISDVTAGFVPPPVIGRILAVTSLIGCATAALHVLVAFQLCSVCSACVVALCVGGQVDEQPDTSLAHITFSKSKERKRQLVVVSDISLSITMISVRVRYPVEPRADKLKRTDFSDP